MEAAIAWLVQTIFATLLVDKMEEWTRQVGLADDVERLQSEAERVEMELLYDADDIVDELDYYRLQQQVEGGTPTATVDDHSSRIMPTPLDFLVHVVSSTATVDDAQGVHAQERVDPSRGNSDIPTSSRGGKKRRSKAWENFDVTEEDDSEKPVKARCKHCLTEVKCGTMNGTSGMHNHNRICKKKPAEQNGHPPNPSSTGDATANATSVLVGDSSGRKRRRTSEEPVQILAANTDTPWDKAELSNRMQQITDQLQVIRGEASEVLKLYGLDSASSSIHSASTTANQHLRTSSLAPRKVYGRVVERNYIMKLIAENKSDGITVLPIVGIAGVGKSFYELASYLLPRKSWL
uniref:Uncharacterized protein n=1 Tax=Aegilops tauschii TaxID=37682 RepID=R7WAK2_AEGTA